MRRRLLRIALWTIGISILLMIGTAALLLYIGNAGIPFVEGDTVVTTGGAYGFEIGMTREECLAVIRERYSKPECYLRVLWVKGSEVDRVLQAFENTEWANYPRRKHGEYKEVVSRIAKVNEPLELTDRWDIDMPASWINTIYLTFTDGQLTQIQKSRWLFERP